MRLAYVTNNASRPPDAVAEHLRELGIEVADADVVTSAQAAARLLAERLADGAAVFVIGGAGWRWRSRERGLRPVQDAGEEPVAVVSGFAADLRWVDGDRRRHPGPRGTALGRLQHRPDGADAATARAPATARWSRSSPGSPAGEPVVAGKPRAAAARGDPAPGRR